MEPLNVGWGRNLSIPGIKNLGLQDTVTLIGFPFDRPSGKSTSMLRLSPERGFAARSAALRASWGSLVSAPRRAPSLLEAVAMRYEFKTRATWQMASAMVRSTGRRSASSTVAWAVEQRETLFLSWCARDLLLWSFVGECRRFPVFLFKITQSLSSESSKARDCQQAGREGQCVGKKCASSAGFPVWIFSLARP